VFTDEERRTLASLAKEVGRRALSNLDPIVTPATLLRRHRDLVADMWTFLERRRPGRPRTKVDIEQLIVRMARDNPSWGYTRIQGALINLDIRVGPGTIRRIFRDHLIEPAPSRGRRRVRRALSPRTQSSRRRQSAYHPRRAPAMTSRRPLFVGRVEALALPIQASLICQTIVLK
jgi:hypothetical protein